MIGRSADGSPALEVPRVHPTEINDDETDPGAGSAGIGGVPTGIAVHDRATVAEAVHATVSEGLGAVGEDPDPAVEVGGQSLVTAGRDLGRVTGGPEAGTDDREAGIKIARKK